MFAWLGEGGGHFHVWSWKYVNRFLLDSLCTVLYSKFQTFKRTWCVCYYVCIIHAKKVNVFFCSMYPLSTSLVSLGKMCWIVNRKIWLSLCFWSQKDCAKPLIYHWKYLTWFFTVPTKKIWVAENLLWQTKMKPDFWFSACLKNLPLKSKMGYLWLNKQ